MACLVGASAQLVRKAPLPENLIAKSTLSQGQTPGHEPVKRFVDSGIIYSPQEDVATHIPTVETDPHIDRSIVLKVLANTFGRLDSTSVFSVQLRP